MQIKIKHRIKPVLGYICILMLIISGCDAIPLSFDDDNRDKLALSLNMTNDSIETWQDIEAKFTVVNLSNDEVKFGFRSGCQTGFTIEKNEEVLVDSRGVFGCTAALSELKLKPRESKTYTLSLAYASNSDPLEPGTYTMTAFLLEDHSNETSTTFEVE